MLVGQTSILLVTSNVFSSDGPSPDGASKMWKKTYGYWSKPWHLVNPKIAGKWMFIPLKMVLIGFDPYPYINQQRFHWHMFPDTNKSIHKLYPEFLILYKMLVLDHPTENKMQPTNPNAVT